jgi:hypothetical protein
VPERRVPPGRFNHSCEWRGRWQGKQGVRQEHPVEGRPEEQERESVPILGPREGDARIRVLVRAGGSWNEDLSVWREGAGGQKGQETHGGSPRQAHPQGVEGNTVSRRVGSRGGVLVEPGEIQFRDLVRGAGPGGGCDEASELAVKELRLSGRPVPLSEEEVRAMEEEFLGPGVEEGTDAGIGGGRV